MVLSALTCAWLLLLLGTAFILRKGWLHTEGRGSLSGEPGERAAGEARRERWASVRCKAKIIVGVHQRPGGPGASVTEDDS